ncbi:MAG: ZIP family metal transporter [Nostocales cyanobacterium 94392]|nr:ZIP family metal transporter [Nostocales cyanobacterium 94392]
MMNNLVVSIFASIAAGLATVIGALLILLPIKITGRVQGIMLGFGGGVMLAATSFSLILPGTEAAESQGYSKVIAALIMVGGIILGGVFLQLAHRIVPHEHFFKGKENHQSRNIARVWLFILAITIHNFPEGLAVGVNFGNNNIRDGIPVALGIGLQNIPEGLVVALSLVAEKYSRGYALWISLLTGLVEPIGGLIGIGVVSIANLILPWAMGFAAGAMLFVISDEIIPESHRQGLEKEGTIGLMFGFVVMMFLDIALS